MATYKQLQDQIARLQREAETARQAETATVVDKLKKQIALYGLTAADVGFGDAPTATGGRRAARKVASRSRRLGVEQGGRPGAGVAKYRDPKSGKTWSGFGRVPAWLASVKDRTRFLIDASQPDGPGAADAETPAATAQPPSKAARKGQARKTAAKTAAKKAAAKRTVESSDPVIAKRPAAKKRTRARTAAPGPETAGADNATSSGTASQASGEGRAGDEAAAS